MECVGHNGLTSQCQIYAGKDASGIVETQLGVKVVKSLTADLKGKGTICILTITSSALHWQKSS